MGSMVGTVVGITHNVLGGKSYFGVNENSTEYTDSLIGLYTSRTSIFHQVLSQRNMVSSVSGRSTLSSSWRHPIVAYNASMALPVG
jgi:hypothetical protein